MIKEVVIVEGRDDITAVKRALDCELIATGGFGFPKGVMERIKTAQKKKGSNNIYRPRLCRRKDKKKNSFRGS